MILYRVPASFILAAMLPLLAGVSSCGGPDSGDAETAPPALQRDEGPGHPADAPDAAAASPAPPPATSVVWSEVKVHEAIRGANPGYTGNGRFQIDQLHQVVAVELDNCGVADLSPFAGMPLQALYLLGCPVPSVEPLRGMPLVELYLEDSAVEDLGPLEGMTSLRKLYLNGTIVSDLSPLRGLPLVELNLLGTRVKDLSPLRGMPLQMLWLTGAPVEDLSPLAGSPLVSLTLHRTAVADLSPLANTRLQRLHIGETAATDLTPLQGLPLTRLVFDPDRIELGIDAIRTLPTLRELGTKFEGDTSDLAPPAVFWSERGQEP